MKYSYTTKLLVSLIITTLFLSSFTQFSSSIDEPKAIRGDIKFYDGSSVPENVKITVTNVDNGATKTITTDSSGHYSDTIMGSHGDLIYINVSYIGNTSTGTIIYNDSRPSQTCDITISENITTLYVDPSFNSSSLGWNINAFNSIQDALDNSKDNDTIFVYNGTYHENIEINKKITLNGENKNATIINNSESNDLIKIISDNVIFSNFTINGSVMPYSGIRIQSSNNCSILNNIIQNNYYGLYIYPSSNYNQVNDNIIQNNSNDGIRVRSTSTNNNISDNTIQNNENDGIRIRASSSYSSVSSNIIQNNTNYGIRVTDNSEHATINDNNIQNNKYGLYVTNSDNCNVINNTIIAQTDEGIFIEQSNNNNITQNDILNNQKIGIKIKDSQNNNINENTIENNVKHAIYIISSSPNNNIENNTISSNEYGILVESQNNLDIKNNIFFNNSIILKGDNINHFIHNIIGNTVNGGSFYYYKNTDDFAVPADATGVILANCTNATITELEIDNLDIGILIAFSEAVNISSNTIENAGYKGIHLINSNTNELLENSLNNNSITLQGSSINHFIHNIIGNTVNGGSFYYYKNTDDFAVPTDAKGLILANCSNATIQQLNISNKKTGLHIAFCDSINISENTFENNTYDIIFTSTNNSRIYNNNMLNFSDSITFDSSNENTIHNNTFDELRSSAVYLYSSSNNNIINFNEFTNSSKPDGDIHSIYIENTNFSTITENNFYNTNYAIFVDTSNHSTINKNFVNNSTGTSVYCGGIWLYKSQYNTINENQIQNSGYGIYVYSSDENTIYHNDFVNNSENNGYEYLSENNHWFNQSIKQGNYWSDYNGVDDNNDGIGDISYNIPADAHKDNYPLISKYQERPYQATVVNPQDLSTNVGLNPTLTVTVEDPNQDSMNISFYNANNDNLIGIQNNVLSGNDAQTTWSGLSYSTSYTWYVTSNDSRHITRSQNWSFTTRNSGGGNNNNNDDEEQEDEEQEDDETETSYKNEVEQIFNITLEKNFYANDTDNDGLIDTFDDPNNILTYKQITTINNNSTFLIEVDNQQENLFLWDTESNDIKKVTYEPSKIKNTTNDTKNNTITVTATINKNASGWIYIEIQDNYKDISNLTVKRSDGIIIEKDKIWRENNKIYVLDDPMTTYNFIYQLPMQKSSDNDTFNPPGFSIQQDEVINLTKPSIEIIYSEKVIITGAYLNNVSIITDISTNDNKIFIYTPKENLQNGEYILKIKSLDTDGNTRNDSIKFKINATEDEIKNPKKQEFLNSLLVLTIILSGLITVVIFYYKKKILK